MYPVCKMLMSKLPFILFLLLLSSGPGKGQDGSPLDSIRNSYRQEDSVSSFAEEVTGDTGVNFRSVWLSEDSLNIWRRKKEYGWIKNLDSLLRKEQDQAKTPRIPSFPSSKNSSADSLFNSGFLQALLWILAGGFVLFVIIQLFMSKGLFRRTVSKKRKDEPAEADEDIRDKDYAALSGKAYREGNFRAATRYLFLMTLQKLQEKELISYAPDKTNSIYVSELPAAKRNGFARLSLYYEYVWYGNTAVQKETFDRIAADFTAFLNDLNN